MTKPQAASKFVDPMMNPPRVNEEETFKLAPFEPRPEPPFIEAWQRQAVEPPPSNEKPEDSQFSLRAVLILTIASGILMAIAREVSFSIIAFGLGLLALVSLVLGAILGVGESGAMRKYFFALLGGYLLLSMLAWLQLHYLAE